MNRKKSLLTLTLLTLLTLLTAATAFAFDKSELLAARDATKPYRSTAAAQAAGYDLVPGLDHCFDNPGVGAMGYHYIDVAALDLTLEPTHPEAIVYAPLPNGRLKLAALEYIVPIDAWEATGATQPPMLFDQHLHRNEALGIYALHVWMWMPNPNGAFADWNPNVTCR